MMEKLNATQRLKIILTNKSTLMPSFTKFIPCDIIGIIYERRDHMAQIVKVRKVDGIKDTVIFMTAYQLHDVKKKFKLFTLRKKSKEIMKQHHICSFSTNNSISTQSGKFEISMLHNHVTQQSQFDIKPKDNATSQVVSEELQKINWVIPLRHAETLLLGREGLSVSFCINMDSFLVQLNNEIIQVDPIIFALKNTLIIAYELIHFDSGRPFSHDEIHGRTHNYNILPVTGLRYFEDSDFTDDNRKISDIIFQNTKSFLEKVLNGKYCFGVHSYVHNIYVMSNQITDIDTYFQKVVDVDIADFRVNDISPQSQFSYFSTEFLGVASNIVTKDNNILFECLLLEAMKMYFCLEMIIEYDVTDKLSELLNRKIYFEHFYYSSGIPAITQNAIDNIRQTISYKRLDKAINYKIEAMKDMQDRKKIKNGILLNVLLYVLAALGGLQAVDILDNKLGFPFIWGCVVELTLFGGLGLLWYFNEKKE